MTRPYQGDTKEAKDVNLQIVKKLREGENCLHELSTKQNHISLPQLDEILECLRRLLEKSKVPHAYLLDVDLFEIRRHVQNNSYNHVKELYSQVFERPNKSTTDNLSVLAMIQEECGHMHMKYLKWDKAYEVFLKSFHSYQDYSSQDYNKQKKCVLVQMIMANILGDLNKDPFKENGAHLFKDDEDVMWFRALQISHINKNEISFHKILTNIIQISFQYPQLRLHSLRLLIVPRSNVILSDDIEDDEDDELTEKKISPSSSSSLKKEKTRNKRIKLSTSNKKKNVNGTDKKTVHNNNNNLNMVEVEADIKQELNQISKRLIHLEEVKHNGRLLSRYSNEYKNDIEIVKAAVINYPPIFLSLNQELHDNREIVNAAVSNGPMLSFVSPNFKQDYDIVKNAIIFKSSAINHASPELKENLNIILEAVKRDGTSIQYISKDLILKHREIILTAINQNGKSILFLPKQYLNDYEVVLLAVKTSPILRHVSNEFQNNKFIVKEALKYQGNELNYASDELKNDYEVVMEAVKQDGTSIQYASKDLQLNYNIVLEAIKQNGLCLKNASDDMKNDYKIVLMALNQNKKSLDYASHTLRDGGLLKIVNNLLCRYDTTRDTFNEILYGAKSFVVKEPKEQSLKQKRSKQSSKPHPCFLPMLNHAGVYPSIEFKKMIFEYIGVKFGHSWNSLTMASANLNKNNFRSYY